MRAYSRLKGNSYSYIRVAALLLIRYGIIYHGRYSRAIPKQFRQTRTPYQCHTLSISLNHDKLLATVASIRRLRDILQATTPPSPPPQ